MSKDCDVQKLRDAVVYTERYLKAAEEKLDSARRCVGLWRDSLSIAKHKLREAELKAARKR